MSFQARFLCICFGGPSVFLFMAARGRDDVIFIWSSLLTVWAIGTAWVLAGKAKEANGWGQLEVGELIFIPLLTLVLVVGSFFMLLMLSFAGMH